MKLTKSKLKEMIKEELLKEAISLKDAEGGIFDIINDFNNMIKKHPVAKKNSKIQSIMKQLYKLEAQLGSIVGELE